ncbi:MAG: hypothetical protein ABID61_03865 [Candidatus Micrarchaeota archaeon]
METPDTPWAKNDDIRIHKPKILPPHQAAIFFYEFLKSKHIVFGRMINLGGGNGQNTVYFAERGFEVHCVDKNHLQDIDLHGVTPHSHNIGDFWQFETDYFDIGFDVSCYVGLQDTDKKVYRNELKRVIQSDGLFILSIPEKDSEKIEKEFSDFRLELKKKIENQVLLIMRLP